MEPEDREYSLVNTNTHRVGGGGGIEWSYTESVKESSTVLQGCAFNSCSDLSGKGQAGFNPLTCGWSRTQWWLTKAWSLEEEGKPRRQNPAKNEELNSWGSRESAAGPHPACGRVQPSLRPPTCFQPLISKHPWCSRQTALWGQKSTRGQSGWSLRLYGPRDRHHYLGNYKTREWMLGGESAFLLWKKPGGELDRVKGCA